MFPGIINDFFLKVVEINDFVTNGSLLRKSAYLLCKIIQILLSQFSKCLTEHFNYLL